MGFVNDTPAEGALIWNPAYTGKEEGAEMKGQVGDFLQGVCLDVNLVDSRVAPGEKEYHVIIGSDLEKKVEATLKLQPLMSDNGFLFICGRSRFRLGSTFVKGRYYFIKLKEMKDIGQKNPYAVYERMMDADYISPAFAGGKEVAKPDDLPY